MKTPKPLEQYADEKAQAKYAENAEIARTNRALRAELQERAEELAAVRKRLDVYEALDAATVAPPPWLVPAARKKEKRVAIPSMLLTDIHWGEDVRPEEIDGLNCYNRRIAEQRIKRGAEGAVKICRDYLSGLEYEGLNLMLGGDLLSGDIHDELRETNVEATTESVVGVLESLVAAIRMLTDHFGKVHIAAVTGNHGRTTKKPRAKRRARDSFDGLVYQLIAREVRSDPRITMQVATGPDAHFSVYNTRFCLSHGDGFKGGSGISGAMAPLLLGVHRKRRRDAQSGNPWDVLVIGHFHQSLFLRDLIVGGAVVGYNEFAYSINAMPEPAQSALWLNTPQRGITAYYPVHLQDAKAENWGAR